MQSTAREVQTEDLERTEPGRIIFGRSTESFQKLKSEQQSKSLHQAIEKARKKQSSEPKLLTDSEKQSFLSAFALD